MPQWNYLCPLSKRTWVKVLDIAGFRIFLSGRWKFCQKRSIIDDTGPRRVTNAVLVGEKNLGLRETGFGIQRAERHMTCMDAIMRGKVTSCFMQINQTAAYMNVLLHNVPGNFHLCVDFNQGWFLRLWTGDLGSNKIFFRPKDLVQNGLLAVRS